MTVEQFAEVNRVTSDDMPEPQVYAIHRDGRKLYHPTIGNVAGLPVAAISIDQDGKTFPVEAAWIRKGQSWDLQDGWRFADENPQSRKRSPGPRRRSLEYRQAQMLKRGAQVVGNSKNRSVAY
jgi:hypothetical protein